MDTEEELVLEEDVLWTDSDYYVTVDRVNKIIIPGAGDNDKQFNLDNNYKSIIKMLDRYQVDETRLTATGLSYLHLLYEEGANINTLVRNKVTEREGLLLLGLLFKKSIEPNKIKGNLRKEPLNTELGFNIKYINGVKKKRVLRICEPPNNMGEQSFMRYYWIKYDNEIESEIVLAYAKKGK
ncbi:hypothetical protein UT300012_21990 [Paraclostridium bifermentans]